MAVGWRLVVQRANRIEHYVAHATDQPAAIEAVRKKRGMAKAVIVASEPLDDDLTRLGLKDGEAQRAPTPKDTPEQERAPVNASANSVDGAVSSAKQALE